MMNSRILRVGTGLAVALVATACNSDKLTDLNHNPNSPVDVPAPTLFTYAARVATSRWLGAGYDLRETEWLAQHLGEIQYTDEDRYTRLHGGDTQGNWNGAYSGEMKDFSRLVEKGTAAKAPGTFAPAEVMLTWEFGYLTDTWGDIPYSTALTLTETGGSLAPSYDKQKDIYDGMFTVLAKASADLTGASNDLGSSDEIYAGSPNNWQKFANSLRLRHALRLINVDPTTSRTQMQAAFAAPGGLILTNADNATFQWPGDGIYNNPWSDNFLDRDDHRMSNRLVNLLVANNDPRLPIYAQPTAADPTKYAGQPNGLTNTHAVPFFNTTSRPGAIFYSGSTSYGTFGGAGKRYPSYLMTAAEVNFALAEAAERGLITGLPQTAAQYYNDALTQSLAQWGVSAAATAAFLLQPGIVYKGGTPGLIQIAQQKWVALYTDGGQAWAEWRRTCQPATVVAGRDASRTNVPRRFEYPVLEYTVNQASVTAAIGIQGTDVYETRVYWDKNPTAAPTYPGPSCGVKNGT